MGSKPKPVVANPNSNVEKVKTTECVKQAGAELCQAQWKLGLAKLDLPSMYFSYI